MLLGRRKLKLETERLSLRPPVHSDFNDWAALRRASKDYLTPWEPIWAQGSPEPQVLYQSGLLGAALRRGRDGDSHCFLFRRSDDVLLGAITLDNIRRGPAQAGTLGYWTGQAFARQGYMREAIGAVVHHAFTRLDLSRIEAACLPENVASRGLLESAGFKYEGVAQSYLQINGRWRTMFCSPVCALTVVGGPTQGSWP